MLPVGRCCFDLLLRYGLIAGGCARCQLLIYLWTIYGCGFTLLRCCYDFIYSPTLLNLHCPPVARCSLIVLFVALHLIVDLPRLLRWLLYWPFHVADSLHITDPFLYALQFRYLAVVQPRLPGYSHTWRIQIYLATLTTRAGGPTTPLSLLPVLGSAYYACSLCGLRAGLAPCLDYLRCLYTCDVRYPVAAAPPHQF